MKTKYSILALSLVITLGVSIVNATNPTNTPLGSPQKEGIFYDYFTNIAKTTGITNPFITGFGSDFSAVHADGNNFIKGYLATLGGTTTDIITGFDASGNIIKTTISAITKKYLGDNASSGTPGQGIIGFGPTGLPIYSKEIGYWSYSAGILNYNGGIQIGGVVPSSLNVSGNITVSNSPSASDDLITKGYADAYMKDICTRFLGSWNDATATCSTGTIPGPSCIPHACTAATPSCGTTTTGTSDSCGTVCTKTGPACTGPNSCAATPSCNGTSCTTTVGSPTSVGQAWTKTGPNCKFTCTGGYTGVNCEIAPSCALEWKKVTPSGCLPNGTSYLGNHMTGYESYLGATCSNENEIIRAGASDYYGGCPVGQRGIMTLKCLPDSSCTGPNSCAATLPSCNGTSCTTTVGSPTSVGQAWTKTGPNCKFTCTGGYTGANCEIPPAAGNCLSYIENWSNSGQGGNCAATIPGGYSVADNQPWGTSPTVTLTNTVAGYTGSVTFKCIDSDPPVGSIAEEWVFISGSCNPIAAPKCYDVKITYNSTTDYIGPSGSYMGSKRCFSNDYGTQKSMTDCSTGTPKAPLSGGGYTNDKCAYTFGPYGDYWGHFSCEEKSCGPVAPTCSDGIQNGSETGVDCGGSCGACIPSSPICEYSIKYSKGIYYDAESKIVPIGDTHVHSLDTTYHWISSDLIIDESGANRKLTCPGAKVDAVCGAAFTCTKGTLDPDSKEATSKESYPRGCYYDWYCNGINGGAGVACHKTTGCFAGEELVTTPTGTAPISSLKVGDKVISYNESTQQFVENTIDKVIIHDGKSNPLHDFDTYPLVRLTTQVNGIKKQTQVTANHLYYSPDEDIYKEIKDFTYGERIRSIDGIGNVVSIMKLSDTPVVYNLHMVNKPNNYLVNGVVVHNEKAEACTGCTGASCDTTTAWDPVCVPNGSCSASTPACETTTYGVDNCGNACSKTGDSCSVVSTNGSCGYIGVIGGGTCTSGTPGPTFDFWGNPVSGWLEGCGASYTWTCEGTGFGSTASCSGNLYHGCGS